MTANEDYLKTTLEKLEVDNKLKCQQFGSHIEESPERDPSPVPKPSPRIIRKTDEETFSNKGDTRSSLLATTRKFKTSVSFTVAMGANSNRTSELTEPNLRKEWQCVHSKACYFLEEDGEIISHQYRMQIAQRSMVYLTIKPLNLSQVEGKPSQWLSVDTALYILFFPPPPLPLSPNPNMFCGIFSYIAPELLLGENCDGPGAWECHSVRWPLGQSPSQEDASFRSGIHVPSYMSY